MSEQPTWEPVIGLEVHLQLRTRNKLFCGSSTDFGAPPNSQVCPVCLGMPGALPVVNGEAVALGLRAALALGCQVHTRSVFARKNYFYPDMPKGYQISQFEHPLATAGRFHFGDGAEESVLRIRRVHLEEDAGKSLHDRFEAATAVDLNRAGVPLVEIVSEPDLTSPAQVRRCLQELKLLLEYLEVSDCNMEEGSLRVDANVSIRPVGTDGLGTKTEIKNLNSFSGVERALGLEIARQRELVEGGGRVLHETLLWDDQAGALRSMRGKEESHDYRYFPEPDLPPLLLAQTEIDAAREALPEAPRARRARFRKQGPLPDHEAGVLTADRRLADLFEAVTEHGAPSSEVSKWLIGPFLQEVGNRGLSLDPFPLAPDRIARLVELVGAGTVSGLAGKRLLGKMLDTGEDPDLLVEREGLSQVSDEARLVAWIAEAIAANPLEAERFQAGEDRLLGYFMGEVMKRSRGTADPGEVRRLLQAALS